MTNARHTLSYALFFEKCNASSHSQDISATERPSFLKKQTNERDDGTMICIINSILNKNKLYTDFNKIASQYIIL